jgi:hypothetical protein
MTGFGELLRSGSVPDTEGFFRVDGTIRRVDYDGPQLSWFELGPPFTPDWEYDPSWYQPVGLPFRSAQIPPAVPATARASNIVTDQERYRMGGTLAHLGRCWVRTSDPPLVSSIHSVRRHTSRP